jgi:post-segregation antitoxin (ccd killing protein)
MPKVSIYLPDPLYDAVRKHDIAVSAVTQQALEAEVRRQANAEWVQRVKAREPRVDRRIDTSALLDDVREEFGT